MNFLVVSYNKFKIRFISVTINLNTGETEYIDYLNKPEMSLLTAISLSIRIPYLYKRLKYHNNYYIDGGLTDPFPISHIDDGQEYIIGLCFNFYKHKLTDLNILDYTNAIFKVFFNKIYELSMNNVSKKCLLIPLDIEDYSLLNFKNNNMQLRLKLYTLGSKFILDYNDKIKQYISQNNEIK